PAGRLWDLLTPTLSPTARSGAAFALEFEPARRRLFVIGGRGVDDNGAPRLLDDVWTFDLLTQQWAPFPTTSMNHPPARADGVAAFDQGRDQIILFGGSTSLDPAVVTPIGDLWALDIGNTVWKALPNGGTGAHGPPSPR